MTYRLRSPRLRLGILSLLVVVALIVAGGALRAGPADPGHHRSPADVPALHGSPASPSTRAEYRSQIEAILADEKAAGTRLQAKYRAARNEAEALDAQRQLRRLRQETEIRLLEAQAERALATGHADLASRIREDIRFLRDPDRASRLARPERGRNPR